MIKNILFTVLLIQTSFVFSSENVFELDQLFQLHKGVTAQNTENAIKIEFYRFIDSRCPKDFHCITEGSATIYLNIEHKNKKYSKQIIFSNNKKSSIEFGDDEHNYRIELLDIIERQVCNNLQSNVKDLTIDIVVRKKSQVSFCTTEYMPVCAMKTVSVKCIKSPCPKISIYKTYNNECLATADNAIFAFEGECQDVESASL